MNSLYQQCCGRAIAQCCGRLTKTGDCCGEPEPSCCGDFDHVGPDGYPVDPITVNFTGTYLAAVAE